MLGPLAAVAALALGCSAPVTVATFNIRMFPEQTTDRGRVAERLVELDASVIAVQEIRDARAFGLVLEDASRHSGRDYQLLIGPCGGEGPDGDDPGMITTGVVYDASTFTVLEHTGYPDLQPDGTCGPGLPGTLAVLEDRRGHPLGVLSVHLHPFPDRFDLRREQWSRVVARLHELQQRYDAPILALGDYNSTGFRGEPAQERSFVEETVATAGLRLPTADLACTEYWRPRGDPGPYRPSALDHAVVTRGEWTAEVRGMCERLACAPTAPEAMDSDYFDVSDHCPVMLRGRL
ncbi:endonuclease/exonuclease/phosphatase family protein [Paraliomyxa miuraensis]|uniref:endonuclease/exonuclease/phosphatase family protein n=1 Tax=Paraliomyxa miuraensis TaxID=376150 RepID=UPI00224DBCBE|nr:endonuclease/exonuclease/phosphatase family protein [Paraliomyxa miuraensis]MCX4240314.1 endonuclease/exonuclease/phosphatase family protein [Paraliomyxa miuraensis]